MVASLSPVHKKYLSSTEIVGSILPFGTEYIDYFKIALILRGMLNSSPIALTEQ